MTQTPDFGTHYLTLGIIPNHPSLSFPRGTMGWLNQSRGFQALAAGHSLPPFYLLGEPHTQRASLGWSSFKTEALEVPGIKGWGGAVVQKDAPHVSGGLTSIKEPPPAQ